MKQVQSTLKVGGWHIVTRRSMLFSRAHQHTASPRIQKRVDASHMGVLFGFADAGLAFLCCMNRCNLDPSLFRCCCSWQSQDHAASRPRRIFLTKAHRFHEIRSGRRLSVLLLLLRRYKHVALSF